MTELHTPPPMTPADHALAAAAELSAIREVLPMIATEHLHRLRQMLRHPHRWSDCGPGVRLLHAAVLEDCAHRLVDAGLADADYLRGIGELAPVIPDSPEGLS